MGLDMAIVEDQGSGGGWGNPWRTEGEERCAGFMEGRGEYEDED